MREIELDIPKEMYLPGETISGRVIVRCDEDFECNAITVDFQGKESSRVTRGSGDDKRTYSESRTYYQDRLVLSESMTIYPDSKRFEFQYTLPKDCPPSYEGSHGWIHHTVTARAEVSWAIDPQSSVKIIVPMIRGNKRPIPREGIAEDSDDETLNAKLVVPSDIIEFGKDFTFRLLVSQNLKIRGVRASISYTEFVSPDGYDETTPKTIAHWELPDEELPRDRWLDISFNTSRDWSPPFESPLIHTFYILKVTLDIPWKFDKTLEIPLRAWLPDKQESSDEFGY